MKKIIIIFICILFVILCCFFNKNNDRNNKKIVIAEVTHSVFYAPLYVAIEKGYFKDEGLDVELILTSGADKVSAAVLSGDAQIGLAGAESVIYIYNSDEKDYLRIFSGLTKRDGQFILSRNENNNFSLEELRGKEVLVGRKGGMPALNFLNALDNLGIDPTTLCWNNCPDTLLIRFPKFSNVTRCCCELSETDGSNLANQPSY